MTIYVTKYVVGGDILKIENHDEPKDGRVVYRYSNAPGQMQLAWPGDWFATEEEARADAKARIERKLQTMEKQKTKLSKKKIVVKAA